MRRDMREPTLGADDTEIFLGPEDQTGEKIDGDAPKTGVLPDWKIESLQRKEERDLLRERVQLRSILTSFVVQNSDQTPARTANNLASDKARFLVELDAFQTKLKSTDPGETKLIDEFRMAYALDSTRRTPSQFFADYVFPRHQQATELLRTACTGLDLSNKLMDPAEIIQRKMQSILEARAKEDFYKDAGVTTDELNAMFVKDFAERIDSYLGEPVDLPDIVDQDLDRAGIIELLKDKGAHVVLVLQGNADDHISTTPNRTEKQTTEAEETIDKTPDVNSANTDEDRTRSDAEAEIARELNTGEATARGDSQRALSDITEINVSSDGSVLIEGRQVDAKVHEIVQRTLDLAPARLKELKDEMRQTRKAKDLDRVAELQEQVEELQKAMKTESNQLKNLDRSSDGWTRNKYKQSVERLQTQHLRPAVEHLSGRAAEGRGKFTVFTQLLASVLREVVK